jgi:sporulation protein YlmC with PRC-barrel domain
MLLLRDVLDKQLLDAKGVKIGRVDGLVLAFSPGVQPRIAFLAQGPETLARRLRSSWTSALLRIGAVAAGRAPEQPFRIPWEKITDIGVDIEVAVEAEATPLASWHKRLRRQLLSRIPGTSR